MSAPQPPASSKPVNLAAVDPAATESVLAATKTAIEAVFSFDPANPGGQQQAVAQHLTGSARTEVDKLLGPVREAGAQVTSKVHDAAVSELYETSARVLVMVDQTSTRPGGQSGAGAAAILAVAKREQNTWRYSEIVVNPTLKSLPKPWSDNAMAQVRDTALAEVHTNLVSLMGVDGNDVDGSLNRQLAVTAEPLLSQMRGAMTNAAQTLKEKRTTVTVARDPMIAAKTVGADLVTGLALVKTTVTSVDAPQPTERVLRVQFEAERQSDGWKFRSMGLVPLGS
nr:hypothetical protein [Kibdelosporangium sp. MJ126-NF4]CTQ88488.1 hypothetical protein [Kibdelosporangium sp. MJ126-NF4]